VRSDTCTPAIMIAAGAPHGVPMPLQFAGSPSVT
jgi:hypothetical protein